MICFTVSFNNFEGFVSISDSPGEAPDVETLKKCIRKGTLSFSILEAVPKGTNPQGQPSFFYKGGELMVESNRGMVLQDGINGYSLLYPYFRCVGFNDLYSI